MATAYLHALRKSDLNELAAASNLSDYESLRKVELEQALDEHLRANQSSYENEKALSDYYRRLNSRSPVKKEPKEPVAPSSDEAPVKKQRRKTKAADELAAASSAVETVPNKVSSMVKTPSRQSLSRVAASVPLPPSPAVVTDMMERHTTRIASQLSEAYTASGITERVDDTRTFLSSAYSVQLAFTAIELYGLFSVILPFKPLITIPPVKYVYEGEYVAKLPDVFQVLKPGFWGPLTLYTSTHVLVPALFAYFFNIAHNASSRGSRRASSSPDQLLDPLVFNIVKALMIVSVYYYHFDLLGASSNFTIEVVKQSVLGGELGMLIAAGVGGLLSLYEAILKK